MAVLMLVNVIVLFGCGESAESSRKVARVSVKFSKPASIYGSGHLKVDLTYLGKVPKKKIGSSDPYCGEDLVSDDLLVGENKELRDAVIYLDIKTDKKIDDQGEAVIDQKGCLFVPKITLAKPGDKIKIKNSDETLHNFHIVSDFNPEINSGMPNKGSELIYQPTAAEFIKMKCDVHPWMGGWIVVRKHPYYAISGPDGLAELKDIPVGKYRLHMRHFSLGHMEQEIEVKENETTSISVEFVKEKK